VPVSGAVSRRTKRIRRSPEEARNAILAAARARLLAHGLDGLKIADVARDAGMSHATLIHHFGSSLGMRDALLDAMTAELLNDFVAVFDAGGERAPQFDRLLERLFATLSDPRNAQLFGWLAMEPSGSGVDRERYDEASKALLDKLLARIQKRADGLPLSRDATRYGVVLAVASAVGLGLARPWLTRMALLDDDRDRDRFAAWVGSLLEGERQRPPSDRISASRSSTGSEQDNPTQR